MAQPLITQFYNKRKRAAEGFPYEKSKVRILEPENKTCSEQLTSSVQIQYSYDRENLDHVNQEETANVSSCSNFPVQSSVLSKVSVSTKAGKRTIAQNGKSKILPKSNKLDIRKAFKQKTLNNLSEQSVTKVAATETGTELNTGNEVSGGNSGHKIAFQLLGSLSPKKSDIIALASPLKRETSSAVRNDRRELGLMTPKKIIGENSKNPSIDEIRNKLNRSSRLEEIRQSIKNFNKNDQRLKELETKRKLNSANLQLKKFTSIDLDVPVSPQKSTVSIVSPGKCSPLKKSPIKGLLSSPSKTPAFQRLAHLVQSGVPSLPLPYSYRILAEIFRCMDTVVSMIYNRKEVVTFDKLKSGVQQMLRRNFTQQHVGQIKTVLPNAFTFSQEKDATFGCSKTNKYQLVIAPVIDSEKTGVKRIKNGCTHYIMTSSLLVERRELFHKSLLEIVKDHHQEFLKKLDPPVVISRASLARWHPDFELERVPSVTPADLPSPPTDEKACSAQDVLDRAKTLFGCNQRMEKALQMVSEQISKTEERVASHAGNTSSNSSLFKGIPKALLEKVRAKQAAKALLAMSRTPAEDQEAIQLLRLPELARVLRNIYVTEKKNVLLLEVALEKLSNSYREALSYGELEQHIRLLIKVIPGWAEILYVRKANYLKVAKDSDMNVVMKKLEKLAEEKRINV